MWRCGIFFGILVGASICAVHPPVPLMVNSSMAHTSSFMGGGARHIVYEVLVGNVSSHPITVMSIDIDGYTDVPAEGLDQLIGKRAHRFWWNAVREVFLGSHTVSVRDVLGGWRWIFTSRMQGEALSRSYAPLGAHKLSAHLPRLAPSEGGIFYFFLDFPQIAARPKTLVHRIHTDAGEIIAPLVIVRETPPVELAPPLVGGGWFCMGGPSNMSYHRRTALVIDGKLDFPERFAVDFVKFKDGRPYRGDPRKKESYYSYGQPLLAVADGVIIRAVDGLPDGVPGQFPESPTLDDVAGNFVLLRLDSGAEALYAHLIPESIVVQEGERVRRGQLLGLLGNSGNSVLPHLHFQVNTPCTPLVGSQKPCPLKCSGIPWTFQQFLVHSCRSQGSSDVDPDLPASVSCGSEQLVEKEIVLDQNYVTFIN